VIGRGAWNPNGVGGTKSYRKPGSFEPIKPGSYYYTGTGYLATGKTTRDANEYAVFMGVKALQRGLNRAGVFCLVDGLYGPATTKAMTDFQWQWANTGDARASVWGGAGPETTDQLLRPFLIDTVNNSPHHPQVTAALVSGLVHVESEGDPGAVGYSDVRDLGLAQINALAHPDLDTDERLTPEVAYRFIVDYLTRALASFALRDAIASYNLGSGGVQKWIAAGRPDLWAPPGTDPAKPRNVKAYIDKVLAG